MQQYCTREHLQMEREYLTNKNEWKQPTYSETLPISNMNGYHRRQELKFYVFPCKMGVISKRPFIPKYKQLTLKETIRKNLGIYILVRLMRK
jgi:hypothetical protein